MPLQLRRHRSRCVLQVYLDAGCVSNEAKHQKFLTEQQLTPMLEWRTDADAAANTAPPQQVRVSSVEHRVSLLSGVERLMCVLDQKACSVASCAACAAAFSSATLFTQYRSSGLVNCNIYTNSANSSNSANACAANDCRWTPTSMTARSGRRQGRRRRSDRRAAPRPPRRPSPARTASAPE